MNVSSSRGDRAVDCNPEKSGDGAEGWYPSVVMGTRGTKGSTGEAEGLGSVITL